MAKYHANLGDCQSFPQNLLDFLIGGLYNSVPLGAISSLVSVSNLKLLKYISHQLILRFEPLLVIIDSGTLNLHIRLFQLKSATTFLVTAFYEVASTHLVK